MSGDMSGDMSEGPQVVSECNDVQPQILGPIVGVAVLVEALTICIAVGCCVYLRHKATDKKRSFSEQASKSYAQHDYADGEDGSKTIRVVHNSLYQSMRSDTDGNVSPVESPMEHNFSALSEAGIEKVLELDLPTKARSRTQSSHAYEPINLHPSSSVEARDQPAVIVEIANGSP